MVTVVVFPLIAYLINYVFSDRPFWSQFDFTYPLILQVVIGVVYGLLAGIICLFLARSSWMSSTSEKYTSRLREVRLNYLDIVLVSICAGVGEEILFRGVLQEFFGVVVTAVLFVAIHGYLNFKDWALSIYGAVMTLIIIGLGVIFEFSGVVIPIVGHAVIDMVLFIGIFKINKINKIN